MVFSLQRTRQAVLKIPAFVLEYSWLLIGMHLTGVLFNQWMMILQEKRMQEKSDDLIFLMFAIAFIGFIFQSFTKVIWTFLVCAHFSKNKSTTQFVKTHLELGLIESLRAFFRAILWGIPLIIPGILKMIRYQFVLFVVGRNLNYQKGQVDALDESSHLTKNHMWGLLFLIIIFGVLSFMLTPDLSFLKDPMGVFIYEFLGFFLTCVQILYFYLLYEDLTAISASSRGTP